MDTISYSTYWENFNVKNYLPDGSDWKDGFPVRQAVLMIPEPGSADYIIFHHLWKNLPDDGLNFHRIVGLLMSKVSFKNQYPDGKTIFKDSLFANGFFQSGFKAIKHGNGRDWWVFIAQNTMIPYTFI